MRWDWVTGLTQDQHTSLSISACTPLELTHSFITSKQLIYCDLIFHYTVFIILTPFNRYHFNTISWRIVKFSAGIYELFSSIVYFIWPALFYLHRLTNKYTHVLTNFSLYIISITRFLSHHRVNIVNAPYE